MLANIEELADDEVMLAPVHVQHSSADATDDEEVNEEDEAEIERRLVEEAKMQNKEEDAQAINNTVRHPSNQSTSNIS